MTRARLARALVIGIGILLSDSRVDPRVSAQSDITDADLERASGGRTVALRALTGGRVANVPLEEYVARVLAGEAEPGAPDATMQALAVAIRTFAIFNAGRHSRDGYDLCDTTHCQVPRAASGDTRRAALATAGRILTYRGAPAEIFYSASCGGRSESASEVWARSNLPYLKSIPDDVHDDDEPWTVELTLDQIRRALLPAGFEGARLRDIEIDDRTDSGRVARLTLDGLRPDDITGEQFRMAIGARALQSTAFSIRRRRDTVTFTGRGYGHGVGMCVIGAGRRARRGESVTEILATYYPGLQLVSLGNVPEVRRDTSVTRPPAPRVAAASPITVRVPQGSTVSAAEIERLAATFQSELARALGVASVSVAIDLHASLDDFRTATNQPWWVNSVASGTSIDLVPATLLAQREGLEPALRVAMAEVLVAPALLDRPVWVRVGAARHFARQNTPGAPSLPEPPRRLQCPADAELTLSVSLSALREAESRAEMCFVRGYAQTRDWRSVK